MTSSKFLTLSLLAATLGLGACSTESRKKADVIQGKSSDFPSDSGTNFRVDAISIDTVTPMLNAYGMAKQKLFNFKACLQDAGGNALLPDIPFTISSENGSLTRKTDQKGCLNWDETHAFSLLADESYLKLTRIFTPDSVYRGRVYGTVALNLWADKGELIDLRYKTLPAGVPLLDGGAVGMQTTRWTTLNRSPLKINVDTIGFDFRGLNYKAYEIRPDLGLTVAHDYEVRLKPTVIRKVIASAGKTESFVGGRMKVYFALFREKRGTADAYDLKNLISASDFTLEDVNNSGTFIGDVTLKFQNISDLSSRTAVLVSLVPIDDEIDGLKEMNFRGVMKPGRVSTLSLRPADVSARAVTEELSLQEKKKPRFRPFQEFVKETSFRTLTDESLARIEYFDRLRQQRSTLQAGLSAYRNNGGPQAMFDLMPEACALVYPNDPAKQRTCRRHGGNTLAWGRVDFLEEVTSSPRQVGITTVETMKMAMSISKSTSVATTSSYGVNASAGLSVGWAPSFLGFFGLKLNAGGSYSIAREWKDSDSASNTVGVSTELSVTSEGNTFQFDSKTRRCLIIAEKIYADRTVNAEDLMRRKTPGVIFCEKEPVARVSTEAYYLLGQNIGVGGSPFSDPEANINSSWRTFVRGRTEALMLYNMISNTKQKLVLETLANQDELREEGLASLTMQSFPGLMVVPEGQ